MRLRTEANTAACDNCAMTRNRIFLWIAATLAAPFVLMTLVLALFGWNWLRGPIEHWAEQKTGRVLAINGDLSLHLGWPWPRIQADAVAFANPPWAQERQMVTADTVDITIGLLVPQAITNMLVGSSLLKMLEQMKDRAEGTYKKKK